ncbi:Protein kinase-like domain [Pseudocohnilembus persalinus]|uniref:Protein kinase-like domain n=1 Tax=Pseudocohnilembus persalinus TaxID=266149 RepID=A0A0V0R219_PSEPJ|nr:Protein kinase-like domain [Pseudocohnilembus persalinus]|eukprot:KRX08529.1 Protein kinase-like domain [Pseudocohnilembus persalinus]
MNQNLPAAVYVPFTSNSVRNYAVLNIVVRESKVFSTKERTPFYICLEIFRPEEENEYELLKSQGLQKTLLKDPKYKWQYDKIVSNPRTCQSEENKIKSVIRQRKTSEGAIANKYLGILHSEDQTIQKNLLHNDNNGDSQQNANGVPQLLIQRRNTFSDGYSLNSFDQNQKEMKQYDVFKNYNSQEKVKSQSQEEIFQNNDENIESEYQESPNQTQQEIISNNKLNVVIKKNNKKAEKVGGVSRFYMDGAVEQLDDGQQSQISMHNKNGDLVIEKENISKQNDQNSIITECSDTSAKKIDFNKKTSLEILRENLDKKLFGEDEKLQAERIRKASPYKHFKSHKLVHLIIKTGDNLKQEQFAMQLLQQFDQIFTEEGLNLKIRTYDIMSIGPDAGLVEMVKNATTFDNLKKQLHENFSKQISNLYHFFKVFYGDKIKKAQELFCQSLAAYSLICYFMQIKDRHNGNILLHKDGYMLHIDFGFFLSNAPGKGLAFEKKVPFKLLSEYIEILGGVDSKFFEQFRILFYKGFMALRKHQDKILILVKMLYTGHGSTLPCFEYGFASLIMAITTLILSKELTDKECGAQSSLANYYTVGSYGESLLCSESCPCYITDRAFNQFDLETQDRIKNFMTQDKNIGYINAQSCPNFQQNLIEQGISIQDGEQIVYHLNRFEQTMKCTAWCNKMDFQNYFFTDINRGPILSGKGCYQMMEKFYWNFSIRFSLFNWMVAGLMFLNIIFTCLYLKHRQIKNDRKISIKAGLFRKLTIFDDEEEDRKQKLL